MLLYYNANGKPLKGLQDRRKAEQDLFNKKVGVKNGKKQAK